jgi:DNA repair protein RadA/Sms
MSKTVSQYVCQECGRISPRQLGRCPSCNSWGSMIEERITAAPAPSKHAPRGLTGRTQPQRLSDITGEVEERLALPIGEFARVLGGGIVPGSIVLVGGDPGIGKSTLMLQMALEMARQGCVLYVSGEESERQIKMRAMRLLRPDDGGKIDLPDNLFLITETNLDTILEHVNSVRPQLVIIDSIQTVYMPELESSAGTVTQVRECSSRLRERAKADDIAIFVIGHVTKEGVIAGPRVLEHIVDTVLYLEGDRFQFFRLLRSVKEPLWRDL